MSPEPDCAPECPACASPRYETAYEQQQRLGYTHSVVCMDCGAFVMNMDAHDRFHSLLDLTPGTPAA